MKTPDEWNEVYRTDYCGTMKMSHSFIDQIQHDAWRAGMGDAMRIMLDECTKPIRQPATLAEAVIRRMIIPDQLLKKNQKGKK